MARRCKVILNHISPVTDVFYRFQNCTTGVSGILSGQVAIITGSGQGIGEAAAHLFAKEGAKVITSDIDKVKSDKVAAAIVAEGGSAISFPGDVTDPTFPERIIEHTVKVFGKINIIVNNAGYTWDGMLHKITDKQWNAILEVHNTAPFRMIRAAAPHMREQAKIEMEKKLPQEPRCIVNVSSTSGLHGNVGQANYSTAKMGIVGLTKTVAKEWGPFGIRCNAIAFGLIDTRLTRPKSDEAIEIDGKKGNFGYTRRRSCQRFQHNTPPKRRHASGSSVQSPLFVFTSGQLCEWALP